MWELSVLRNFVGTRNSRITQYSFANYDFNIDLSTASFYLKSKGKKSYMYQCKLIKYHDMHWNILKASGVKAKNVIDL